MEDRIDHTLPERLATLRRFYARIVTGKAGVEDARIVAAFGGVDRAAFVGRGPWRIPAGRADGPEERGYVATPDDDPAFLYQDVLVALDAGRGINNGQPSLHARCLAALAVAESETVVHVGAGTGYYSAILAHLVGPSGRVHAYEIDDALAARAAFALVDHATVDLHANSGTGGALPKADVIYVNAGAVQPDTGWLEALRPGGRLLFPMQPAADPPSGGGMLLVTRPTSGADAWAARFVSPSLFIPCAGATAGDLDERLVEALKGGWWRVRSLRFGQPDISCWFAADHCWLSTTPPP